VLTLLAGRLKLEEQAPDQRLPVILRATSDHEQNIQFLWRHPLNSRLCAGF
jgi:hypothetical protein